MVKISRVPLRWIMRNTYLSTKRPTRTTAAIMASAFAAEAQPLDMPASAATGASSGNRAIIGIAAMSWNSRMPKLDCPTGASISRFCSRIAITIAVEDSDSAKPAATPTRHCTPKTMKIAASSAAHSATWIPP
ncbi:hypothetical protein D3C80_1712590 [compost metagenome]